MIQLLTGENDFELTEFLATRRRDSAETWERYEGSDLSTEQLGDIFAGQTLFALKRLVVIDNPSANQELWQNLPDWIDRLNDDTHLILIEPKLDKRTSTYKWLKKSIAIKEFKQIDSNDRVAIMKWLSTYASEQGNTLTSQQLEYILHRVGPNQGELAQAVDKLALVDKITDKWIDDVVQASSVENVFGLFETALGANRTALAKTLNNLRLSEDPYRVFGLVSSQALQLALLVHAGGNVAKVAADTNAKSSYPLQKMAPLAASLSKQQTKQLIRLFANADTQLKSSDADPWLVLESTLAQVASL